MELRDYLNVIRARKWVIVQATVILTLAAVVVSLLLPPTYQGEARVLISEKDTGAAIFGTALTEFSAQPERGLMTQVQLMQLRPLAERAIRKNGLRMRPDQLLSKVSVAALGQTNVVVIVATDGDPKRAAAMANGLADAYVEWSKESKRESIKAAVDEVERRLGESKEQILALGRKINDSGKSDELSAELQIATGLYTTLAERLESLRVNEQLEIGSGRVVSRAIVSSDPVSPKPTRNGVLGFAFGLAFGLAMAFLYEYLDNTIKSTDEAETLYGAPVLGHIPAERFEKGEKRRLTIVEQPGSPAAEAYRVLRNSLDFINFEHEIRTIVVTSAAPGEGKSTVAANLATSLAQAGKKVVLMSCDFRKPTTEQFFGVANTIGLSEVLTGANSLKSALQRPAHEQLLVLTAGKMPPNPSELLGSHKMRELLTNLGEWADWIIVDTPPLLAVADPAAVARWADGVLLVTRGGTSTREAAKKGREMLEKVGARIVGVVVWGLGDSASAHGYGYYYDGYYGGYYGSYYYSDYYAGSSEGRAQPGKKAKTLDSGAKALINVQRPGTALDDVSIYIPEQSPGRRFASFLGRVMTGVLSFVVVVIVILVLVYFLDRAFGWGFVTAAYRMVF